ncbi:E3 ubiquitin-protein ligase makorin-2 [Mastacembelus armatus]|uniref:E3 ubiquitin-protein ligase makorin-2 n=1 Tax=Mastacembelus armatus TaxID=205130 RepID=UPI000E457F58|nr:probable E3 ubiquitin-protein ligase makorin-2 [Mastacembelus armatus]XP_026162484.1 probable E3 ubiquitin-protein ligase makorin-2 [Mastacembelus armatus]XP_026162485.1 probable E3 ubiquitin-protein ligase makorin-2 [Mastacembelus armatus]
MSTKQVTCRYFLHGVCREGSRCLFSHDLNNSKPSTVCKFYQRGTCAYGERCRYDHIKPKGGVGGASEEPAGAAGGGASVRGGMKRTLVLRDRVLGVDSMFGGPAHSLVSEVAAAPQSYVDAIRSGLDASVQEQATPPIDGAYQNLPPLCPYAAAGHCYYEEGCTYLHGDQCEMCGLQVLHPHDPEQRRVHEKMCLLDFEADMEKAFASQLSQDKVCSVCMEVVVQKANPSDRRFGILSSCSHTFCLACIRQWRCTKNFSNKIIKSCPECRVVSEFVIPSVYWVEDQDDKNHLIDLFKSGVSKKACKYFDQGRGSCPFGGKCLYLHAFPDGTRAEPDRPRKQLSSEGNVRFMNSVRLWDFIEEREQHSAPPLPSHNDDITELRELFMQMSGPSHEGPETPPTASQ